MKNNWNFTQEQLEDSKLDLRPPISSFVSKFIRNRESLIDYHLGVYIRERLGYTLKDIEDLGKRVNNLIVKNFHSEVHRDNLNLEYFYYKNELLFTVENVDLECKLIRYWEE